MVEKSATFIQGKVVFLFAAAIAAVAAVLRAHVKVRNS